MKSRLKSTHYFDSSLLRPLSMLDLRDLLAPLLTVCNSCSSFHCLLWKSYWYHILHSLPKGLFKQVLCATPVQKKTTATICAPVLNKQTNVHIKPHHRSLLQLYLCTKLLWCKWPNFYWRIVVVTFPVFVFFIIVSAFFVFLFFFF